MGGWRMNTPNIRKAIAEKDTIARISFGVPWIFHVLRTDGRIDFLREGKVERGKEVRAIDIITPKIAKAPDGTFFVLNNNMNRFEAELAKIPSIHRIVHSDMIVANQALPGGSWKIWRNSGGWRRDEPLESVLGQASDIHVIDGYVLALLPASLIPRSGVWETGELAKLRN